MKCQNEKCGKEFKPLKPWSKYCSRVCGDLVRHRAHYSRHKHLTMSKGSSS